MIMYKMSDYGSLGGVSLGQAILAYMYNIIDRHVNTALGFSLFSITGHLSLVYAG